MSKAAPRSVIEQLHDAVAKAFLDKIIDPVTGELREKIDPRVLSGAARFVKENDVAADDAQPDAVGFQYRMPEDELRPLEEEN